jgi:hypothetical protein
MISSDLSSGTALRFNQEQNKRYADLRNCHDDTCYIEPIKHWPASIEQGSGEEYLSNPLKYWDIYFNKKMIVIKQNTTRQ